MLPTEVLALHQHVVQLHNHLDWCVVSLEVLLLRVFSTLWGVRQKQDVVMGLASPD